jgi:hypothetical protein
MFVDTSQDREQKKLERACEYEYANLGDLFKSVCRIIVI